MPRTMSAGFVPAFPCLHRTLFASVAFRFFQLVKLEIGRADLMQWNNKGFNCFGETLRRLPQTLSLSTLRGGEGSHLNRFLPLSTRVMTCALIAGLHPSTPSDKMSFPVAVLASARVPSEVGVKAGKSQVRAEEVCFRAERGNCSQSVWSTLLKTAIFAHRDISPVFRKHQAGVSPQPNGRKSPPQPARYTLT